MRIVDFYVPGNSWLHRLHPSVKLILYLCWFLIDYAVSWPARWGMLLFLFLFLWMSGIPPWRYKAFLILTGISIMMLPLLNALVSTPDDPIIYTLWNRIAIHRDGLEVGLAFAGLYGAIGIATAALVTSTRIWELAEAPTCLGVHHVVGFVIADVLRYMPKLFESYQELSEVWQTRGIKFDEGTIWARFMIRCQLLAVMMILEFAKVHGRSHALQARGFSRDCKPTQYIISPISSRERNLMAVSLAITVFVLALRVAIYLQIV